MISIRTKQALETVRARTEEENERLGKQRIGRSEGCNTSIAVKASLQARKEKRQQQLKDVITIAQREREHGSIYRSIAGLSQCS